jgi:F420-dependent oxidoreductase-like protein
MKLGLAISSFTWEGGPARSAERLGAISTAAEDAGFDSIVVGDHLWLNPWMGGPEGAQLEAYTTLGFLAAKTSRVKLMTLVTAAPYRHPGMLAKIVTTLDVLSGGRAWLGIGAGDDEAEARGLGLPYPPIHERFGLLEETLQVCLRMWTGPQGDERPFEGPTYRLERPLNLPQSLSRPHPPILIGGDGEHRTLPLVARYADAAGLRPTPDLPRKLDVLRKQCEIEGRDFESIERTCVFAFDVGPDGSKVGELLGQLRWLASMGIQTVIGRVTDVDRIEPLEILGRQVIPAVADL